MKIISKYKDYYDYLTGIYGIDEKVVYERHSSTGVDLYNKNCYSFHICGQHYLVVYYEGKLYVSMKELMDLYDLLVSRGEMTYSQHTTSSSAWSSPISSYLSKYKKYTYTRKRWWQRKTDEEWEEPVYNKMHHKTDVNDKEKCPIVLKASWTVFNPRLEPFNLSKILPPMDIYLALCEWLSYKEPNVATPPEDMNRFESKGFDKKSSFRKM